MKRIFSILLILASGIMAFAQKDSLRIKNLSLDKLNIKYSAQLKNIDFNNTGKAEKKIMPEPEYIFGYVCWTDPSTGKKHIPKGIDRTSMKWEYIIGYPQYRLIFTNRATGETRRMEFNASGTFNQLVDSTGRQCFPIRDSLGNLRYRGVDTALDTRRTTTYYFSEPIGYKYKFPFRFDKSFTGLPYSPLVFGAEKTAIVYNPDIWSFTSISIIAWNGITGWAGYTGWTAPERLTVPSEEFPVRPLVWSLKPRPFSDLPDF